MTKRKTTALLALLLALVLLLQGCSPALTPLADYVADAQYPTATTAKLAHKALVALRLLAPQPEVTMGRSHVIAQFLQETQQGH